MAYVKGKSGTAVINANSFDDTSISVVQLSAKISWEEMYDVETNSSILTITDIMFAPNKTKGSISNFSNMRIYYNDPVTGAFTTIIDNVYEGLDSDTACYQMSRGSENKFTAGTYYPITSSNEDLAPLPPWQSQPIKHTDFGRQALTLHISVSGGAYLSETTGSYIELTTIVPSFDVSVPNSVLGEVRNISVLPALSGYTYSVSYTCGDYSVSIQDKAADTIIPYAFPLELATQNLTGDTVTAVVSVKSYKNGVAFGESAPKTLTLAIPDSVKPSCTIAVSDASGCLEQYGAYVKSLSRFNVRVTPGLAYNSPIESYRSIANDDIYMTAEYTTGGLKSSGKLAITATVTDARKRTSDEASLAVDVWDYTPPAISKLTVHRCKADGTEDNQGEYVMATFTANVTALNNLNTAAYVLNYKKSGDSNWTGVALDDLFNHYSVTDYEYIFPADTGSSYDVRIAVEDNHIGSVRVTSASSGFTLIHYNAKGNAIAFGKISERENAVEIGMDMYDVFGQFHSVEVGEKTVSGIKWYYKKWANGDVELWGSYEVTNLACTTALGSMYRTAALELPSFPFSVYYPNLVASYESSGYGAMLWATSNTSTTKPPSYYLVRPTSATIASGKINFHITGKWIT